MNLFAWELGGGARDPTTESDWWDNPPAGSGLSIFFIFYFFLCVCGWKLEEVDCLSAAPPPLFFLFFSFHLVGFSLFSPLFFVF